MSSNEAHTEAHTEAHKVFRGTFIHSTHSAAVQVLRNAVLGLNRKGKICFIGGAHELESLSEAWHFKISDVRQLKQREFFMPGLVDTHIHAPQYRYTGTALDLPLLEWLNRYTFPVEMKYGDPKLAEDIYTKVVKRTLKNGTTTACYFATIHTDSSLLLGEIADKYGQRAQVGKVCMDTNDVVKAYKETTADSLQETER